MRPYLLIFALVCGPALRLAGQVQPPAATSSPSSGAAVTPAPAGTPITDLMQPALDHLQGNLNGLHVERWKATGGGREEISANVASIRRDIQTTLPPLLAAADASPSSVAAVLPVFRNIDALYDVYLRVVEAAIQFGPRQQGDALEEARTRLDGARRSLGDKLQTAAEARERQLTELRAALNTRPATAAAPSPCPVPTPAKKKRKPS